MNVIFLCIFVYFFLIYTQSAESEINREEDQNNPATDLAGELMVHSQTQGLFLQSNQGRWALLTTSNFPLRLPEAGAVRPGASAQSPGAEPHRRIDALPDGGAGEGAVGAETSSLRSQGQVGIRVTLPPASGAYRSGTLLVGLLSSLCCFNAREKSSGLTVMLHFTALRDESEHK